MCVCYRGALCALSLQGIATALEDTALVRTHCRKPYSSLHLLSVKQNTNRDMVSDHRRKQGHWAR